MKLLNKGPSSEGPKSLRGLKAFKGFLMILAVAISATPALAQYTVEAGKSVSFTVVGPDYGGWYDGARDDPWAGGIKPSKGTINYPLIDQRMGGVASGTATYTAGAASYGQDTVRWGFRCEPIGNPFPCGGGSATITITPSGPPTLANGSINVAYKGSGNTSFSPTFGGNLRIGSSPLKGTAVVYNGTSVRYQAADLAYGSDSFTVISANEKGDSQPATVTVNIGNPPPPVAKTITMRTYSAVVSGTPEVDGVYDRLEIIVQPTRGVLSVTDGGKSLTWDSQGFNMGPDEFCLGHGNIRAVGVGGAGPTVAISLCSSAPRETTVSGGSVSILANTSGTHDFAPTNDGVVSISTDPASGTVTLNGSVATYTPHPDFMGSDSFAAFATNIAGPSAPVTVNVTVNPPPIPTVSAGSLSLAFNASGTHDFAPTQGGTLAIASVASHGTVTINGGRATYNPNPDFIGNDSFSATATNLGGTSAPATVNVTVAPPPIPTVSAGSLSLAFNASGTHDFAPTQGGTLAIASVASHGTVTINGGRATYNPNPDFIGDDSFSATATNLGGTSDPATVNVTVAPPPIPTVSAGSLSLAFNASGTHDFAPTQGGTLAIASVASHGTVTINGGRATYNPNPDFIGDDSFSVTATNLGGTSAPATVNVTVAPPPIPTLTGGSMSLAFNQVGVHDFAPTQGGTLALASAPSHGVVTINGGRATYTPNPDFIGDDSYSVTGENLGGKSIPVSVNVTVSKPDAPGAGSASLTTPYETIGRIELPASGIFSMIAIVDEPTNGTVTVVGTTATYTPAPGFFGDDAFTYQVTGFGGPSGIASVAVKVGLPNAPTITATATVQTPFGQAATIPLKVSGVVSSLKVAPLPAHGTATIGSNEIVYQPSPGFSGLDKLSVIAVGPGGDSVPAEIEVTVAAEVVVAPPAKPPVSKPGALSQEGQAGSQMRFRVTAGITETVQAVEILSQPTQGQAHVDALDVIYSPPADFVGQVAFDYRILTEAGASEPATLTATVHAPAQEAPVKAAEATTDDPASVELTEGVEGGPFSDAAIVSMSPASAGTVELIRGNSASPARSSMRAMASTTSAKMGASPAPPEQSAASFKMLFKPSDDFFGVVTVRYSLTNRFDAPTMGVVKITVDNRKDPTLDPKVAALVNSQADTIGRFGETQIANTSRRLESVRAGATGRGGVSFGSARPSIGEDPFTDRSRQQMLAELREATSPAAKTTSAADQAANSTANPTRVSVWTGGSVQLGERRAEGSTGGFDFTTSGVSVGADYKISDHLVVGAGAGFGRDVSDLGDDAKVKAHGYSSFLYASFKPSDFLFIDGVVGGGRASFTTNRLASSGASLHGERDGSQWFAGFSGGLELKLTSWMISPYGRFEAMSAKLEGYSEEGELAGALRFASQRVDRQSGILGLRGSRQIVLDSGLLEPTFRGEYRWSLRDTGVARLDYAHGQEGTRYEIPLSVFEDEALTLGLGAAFRSRAGWNAWLEWEASMQGAQSTTNTLRAGGNLAF